jgi:integrase
MNANSTMRTLAEQYLKHRRSLGFQLKIEGRQLLTFAQWADRSGHRGPLTVELAVRWATLPTSGSRLYHAKRLEVVRCFARYRVAFDCRTEIPPKGLLGRAHCRSTPHIYTPQQIRQLIDTAMRLKPTHPLRPLTYATLLGLLACTGLRISEALRLRSEDVDLSRGVLRISQTKFRKSRFVPLHPSATEAMRSYAQTRARHWPARENLIQPA